MKQLGRGTGLSLRTLAILAFAVAAMVAAIPVSAQPPIQVEPSICRGAGFWSTHAGNEKGGANLTQELLTYAGCVEVCGEVIDSTAVNDADSALEGLCVSPKGGGQIQLARQLTAYALNCILSTGSPACGELEAWEVCNEACAVADPIFMGLCRSYFDCTNNGGLWEYDESGLTPPTCQTGTCELIAEGIVQIPCGPGFDPCALGSECVPTIGCDDATLVSDGFDFTAYEDWASSPKKCNQATKSRCAIVGVNEAECGSGNKSTAPEACDPN